MPKVVTIPGKKSRVLKAKGDGNCGPRAIIQSLLVQGILQNKREWVLNFIKELIARAEANVKRSYGLDKPAALDHFISQYETLTLGQLENFSQDFFIGNVNSDTPIKHSEDIDTLLDRQDESEIAALLNRIAPPVDNSARDDSIIYFLNACLRKDAASFVASDLGLSLITLNPDLDKLDDCLEIESITPYLKHYNIQLVLHKANEREVERRVEIYEVSEPELSINIVRQGNHFDVLLFEDELDASFLGDEEVAKRIQIQEDEEAAKALQIEEIELFVLKNKASGNQNNLAFMYSFIDNLGLKEELTSNEFSTGSYFFKNYNIIEQLVEVFKLAITKLGYSYHFKDEIKEQTQKYFPTFFSSCRQTMINTDQTPSSQPPTIRCN